MINKFMHLMYEGGPLLQRVQLKSTEREVINQCLAAGTLTAARYAEDNGLTLHYASALLYRLYRKGYLTRKPDPTSTNGVSFIYKCNPRKWK
jgi:DNA-binding MarR family transcriptional regulator